MSKRQNTVSMISIGALSRASGIPAETIRTWERRYGFPVPERRESGHRRYPAAQTIDRLRLIRQALDSGYKPSVVVPAELDALRELLDIGQPKSMPGESGGIPLTLVQWMGSLMNLDSDGFNSQLQREWHSLGAKTFMEERLGPFLHIIGDQWRKGRLGVMHEHLASELLREFLSRQWRPMSNQASGSRIICTTLPGEDHVLGLHMAAVILAISNCQLIFLGANTPLEDISRAVTDFKAEAVIVSLSEASDPERSRNLVKELRALVGPDLPVALGGRGAPAATEDATPVRSFDDLQTWADALQA